MKSSTAERLRKLLRLPYAEYVLSASYHSRLRPRWIEAELYHDWAVEALSADFDTPSLRKIPTDSEHYEFARDVKAMLRELGIAEPDEQTCIRLLFIFYVKVLLLHRESAAVIFCDIQLLAERSEKGEYRDFLNDLDTVNRRFRRWKRVVDCVSTICTRYLSSTKVDIVQAPPSSSENGCFLQITTAPIFYSSYKELIPPRRPSG